MYVLAGSSVVGGLLYQVAPLLPLALTVAALAAAGLTCMFVSEPVGRRTALGPNSLMDILRAIGSAFRGRPELICLYVFVAATFSVTLNGFWTQQPYYLHIGIPLLWFGVLAGASQLLSGLAGSFGHWLDRHLSPGLILGGLLAGLSAAYLVSGLWPGLHGVGLLMFGAVAWGVERVRETDATRKRELRHLVLTVQLGDEVIDVEPVKAAVHPDGGGERDPEVALVKELHQRKRR